MSSALRHRRQHRSETPPQRMRATTILDDTAPKFVGVVTTASACELEAIQKKYAVLRQARHEQLIGDIANAVLTLLQASETRSVADPVVVDAPEAARLLGITVNALRLRAQRGQMPAGSIVRTGRRVQFKTEALRAMRPSTKRNA